jgi:uncharacterized membrane protein
MGHPANMELLVIIIFMGIVVLLATVLLTAIDCWIDPGQRAKWWRPNFPLAHLKRILPLMLIVGLAHALRPKTGWWLEFVVLIIFVIVMVHSRGQQQ